LQGRSNERSLSGQSFFFDDKIVGIRFFSLSGQKNGNFQKETEKKKTAKQER